MSLRFHEIAEANHHILDPFSHEKLMLLGEICHLQPGMSQLDLCCGKGEMLCQWAGKYAITGTGVDISTVFLEAAKARAYELNVSDKLNFVEADAAQYPQDYHEYDLVSCIGATWIGNGVVGTLELMKPALKPGGLLLIGELYWIDMPPSEAYAVMGIAEDEFASLSGTLERFELAGVELVEIVLADADSWDRYVAPSGGRFPIGCVTIQMIPMRPRYGSGIGRTNNLIWPIPGAIWVGVYLCYGWFNP
jgi:ubiquinone/menaquinone biosynthesis C-methylase UbiE